MRRRSAAVALGLASVFGFAALSAEKPPESYSNLMKSLSATAQALRRDAAATPKDYDALSKHAAALKTAYAAAEEFWTARKTDDAIQISKNGGKAAADLDAAAKAKDDAAIATSAAAATGTCMGCHAAHRIRNEDGTYEIK